MKFIRAYVFDYAALLVILITAILFKEYLKVFKSKLVKYKISE